MGERATPHMIGQHGRQTDIRLGRECFLESLTERPVLAKGDHQGRFANRIDLIIDHQAEAAAAVGPAAMGMAIVMLLILYSS
jgi:hypothetical protein